MESFTNLDLSGLSTQELNATVALAVAAGTLYCFLGYRTLRFVLALTGFLLAGLVAGMLAGWVTQGHLVSMGIAAAIGGICGAMALFFLYKTGIFVLGMLGAILCANNVLAGNPESWVPLAVIGIGLAGGLIALMIERPVMMLATAAIGAWFVVGGLGYFLVSTDWLDDWLSALRDGQEQWVVLAAWGLLALLGAFAQFATTKQPAPKPA